MRFSIYSLRAEILAYLTFRIASAMLMINVVMVKFSARDLIWAKAAMGRLLIRALSQKAGHRMAQEKEFSGCRYGSPI
ncbi:MAG: hypothetical protein QGG48_12400 [Desulfatiglandales bacterium]|nr:hypothetical protein [Desulfatiglandales bacterium]